MAIPRDQFLYAVRAVDTAEELPGGRADDALESMRLTKVATVNESEFEAIKSFESISIPFGVIYIDRS